MKKLKVLLMITVLIALPLAVIAQGPTEPVVTGEVLLDDPGPAIISLLLEAKTLPAKVKAGGAVGGAGILMLFAVGLLRTRQLKGWLWDRVSSKWRVIVVLCVAQVGGILMNIHGGDVLWYNAVLDGLFLGGEALLVKKVLWNALLKEGQVAKLDVVLNALKLR